MAEFNKDQNPLFPDNTSDSKGIKANTAMADLFANAGDIAIAGVQVADQENMLQIQKSVSQGIDSANDEWGVSAPLSETPKDIQAYGQKLSVTRKAFLNGNLRESDYQNKIDSMSKQIRARFPGYRDEIDRLISTQLGQSTANDLRRTLMKEWDAQAAEMGDDDKRFAIEVTAARQDGALPPMYDLRIAEGKPMDKQYTRAYMASFYSRKAQVSAENAQLELKAKQGTATKNDLKMGASNELNFVSSKVYEGTLSVLEEKFPAIREKINKGLVKPLTPEETVQVTAGFSKLENEMKSQLWATMNKPMYAGLDFKEKEDLIKSATAQLELMKEQITNGDFGLLKGSEQLNKTILQNDLRNWQTGAGGPAVRMINLAKTFSDGNAQLDMLFFQNKDMGDALNNATLTLTTGELFNTQHKSMLDLTKEAKQKSGGTIAPEVLKQTYYNSVKILSQKDVSLELAQQQAKLLFSEENQAFLGEFTTKSQWQLFDLLISPRMTERMTELGKSDPQMLTNYRNWVLNSGLSLFNQDIATVRDTNQFSDNILIKWDAATGQFKEEPNPAAAQRAGERPAIGDVYENWANSSARASMNKMNKYIRQLKPILDNEGSTVEEAMTALMERMGVTTVENQGSFFVRLYDAIGKHMTATSPQPRGKTDQYVRGMKENPELQGIDLDQTGSGKLGSNSKLKDTIRKAEGTTGSYNTRYGGATDIELSLYDVGDVRDMAKIFGKKSGSSAIGAYQFMPETIDRLVKLGVVAEDDRFTPELQEKMADYLIAEATQGAKGREDAGRKLAKVWAGLPQGADNTSPYTGVGQNKGPTITWDELMAAF